MSWVTWSIAVGGIGFIFSLLLYVGYKILKEHEKLDEKRDSKLKGK